MAGVAFFREAVSVCSWSVRAARSFAIILLCVVIVFTAEAMQDKSLATEAIDLLLRLQWFGIVFHHSSKHLTTKSMQ